MSIKISSKQVLHIIFWDLLLNFPPILSWMVCRVRILHWCIRAGDACMPLQWLWKGGNFIDFLLGSIKNSFREFPDKIQTKKGALRVDYFHLKWASISFLIFISTCYPSILVTEPSCICLCVNVKRYGLFVTQKIPFTGLSVTICTMTNYDLLSLVPPHPHPTIQILMMRLICFKIVCLNWAGAPKG
jgi:hypothetical protein